MRITGNKGTILIRVMAVGMILMVAVIGLAPLMVINIDSNSLADELGEANNLAQDRIEELRCNRVYTTLPFYKYETEVRNKYCIISKVDDFGSDPMLPDSVYRIHVNVSWADHKNKSRSINYKTYTTKE